LSCTQFHFEKVEISLANSSNMKVELSPTDLKEATFMACENSNKHLTLDERRIIKIGIEHGSQKSSIANTLGKDKSTIGKEIQLHRVLRFKCAMPLECSNYRKCSYDRHCTLDCPDYIAFVCKRRDRSPGACNGCSDYSKCRFNKYYYDPEAAQKDYEETLVDSRVGFNLTTSEAKRIGDTVAPLLKQGQSPYQIVTDHPELGICEKTLYNYIKGGALKQVSGITVMDLRRTVSRKLSKSQSQLYKKRDNREFLKGRDYKDYQAFLEANPLASIVQMDTVYNDETNGPFIQTFKFPAYSFLFAVFHTQKLAANMVNGVITLENILGHDLFEKFVSVLLTDRGSEFSNPLGMEKRPDGSTRTRVFYCDPMRSNQKGSLENKHIELRFICPKEVDLYSLGLTSQHELNRVLSHLNSRPLEALNGKSPFEMVDFFVPEMGSKFREFGLEVIPKSQITLKPYLLKG